MSTDTTVRRHTGQEFSTIEDIENINILHVDDDPDFVDMAAEFLERQNDSITVETATSASQGLTILKSGGIDCVVSDYDMPGQNGIEFLETVREDHPELPFILFTGKGSEEIASKAISAGVTEYLQKGAGTSQYAVLANRIMNTVEQYQARHAFEASQKRLSLFIDQSPIGVIEWNENFEFCGMNEKAEEILGYSESELIGDTWETIVPESELKAFNTVVSNLLDDQGGYQCINENVRKDGERITCEWHNRVVTDRDGTVVAIFSQFQDITEQKERERKLARQRAILKAQRSSVLDGQLLVDEAGQIVSYNEQFVEMWDIPSEILESRNDTTALDYVVNKLANPEAFRKKVQYLYDNIEETARDEIKLADGRVFDRYTTPLFGEDGTHYGRLWTFRDITDQKERERELRETKNELQSEIAEKEAQNQAFDDFLNIVNDASLSFGAKMTEVLELGVEFLDLDNGILSRIQPPDYTVEHVYSLDGSIEQGAVLDFTDTYCALVYDADGPVAFHSPADGGVRNHPSYRDLGLKAYLGEPLIVDGERYGTLNFTSPSARDEPFTDGEKAFIRTLAGWASKEMRRTEREREIQRLNQLYNTVLSNMQETVLLTSEMGQITYVSPNANDNLGLDAEEVIDLDSVSELFGERLSESDPPLSTEDDQTIETTLTDNHGSEITVLVTVQQVDIETGTCLYAIRDITERKERESKLQQQNDRLKEFVNIVSHDLRNPLSIAQGQLELARENGDPDNLDDVASAHERMEKIIEELLELAKTGTDAPSLELVNLARVVDESYRYHESTANTVNNNAEQLLKADRNQLKLLMGNLISNAVEHGGVDVTITVGKLPNGWYIEDDGPGIPDDQRDQVFESGFTTKEDGTGFGLNIVNRVVRAHGWSIRVTESKAGGARFEITGVETAA